MSISVTPIPRLIDLAAPAFTLGTANAAGSAETAVASDSTLLVFDTTSPGAVAASAVVGTATTAPRRDHVHAGLVFDATAPAAVAVSAVVGTATTAPHRDHVHAGSTNPVGANLDLASYLLVGNGGSTGIAISAAGEVTKAAQPALLATPASNVTNVTGDGTDYTVVWGDEIFDQGSDFDGASTFTAPVTGRYMVAAFAGISGITTSHTSEFIRIAASNRNFSHRVGNPATMLNSGNQIGVQIVSIIDMDAADTFTVVFDVSGGAQVVGVFGGTGDTQLTVYLVA